MSGTPGAELAPRDVVARAIGREIARGGKVFLDARELLGHGFASRFPLIHALCAGGRHRSRPRSHPRLPGRALSHGRRGDGHCRSHLYRRSLGRREAACTGLQWRNRLASNSLLEGTVMGLRAAQEIAGMAAQRLEPCQRSHPAPAPISAWSATSHRAISPSSATNGR